MNYERNDQLDELGLHYDNDARRELFEATKWARLISIFVFVGCGLFVLLILLAGSRIISYFEANLFASLGESGVVLIIAGVAVLLALVVATYYFLFSFSSKTKDGLITENTPGINAGFASLKLFFIITSVISILSLLATIYQAFAARITGRLIRGNFK